MQSEDAPRSASDTAQESTRGVRLLRDRPGRPNPYGVEWAERVWDHDSGRELRKVKKQYFPSAKLRDKRAAELRKARREGNLRTLNRREVDEWLAFRDATEGAAWQEVVAGWRAHLMAHGLAVSGKTVASHVKDYLADMSARLARGEVAAGTECHHRTKLGIFAADFRERRVAELGLEDVKLWLTQQERDHFAREKSLMRPGTWNNYRKIVSAFFASAVDARLRKDNPCAALPARHEGQDAVGILTVPQIAQLLHTARTFTDAAERKPYVIGLRRLALEVFAGVRFSSACRLTPEDVKLTDRGIRHPARSIKTKRRQYIDGYPDALWAWLAIAPDDAELNFTRNDGSVDRERRYLELKSRLFHAAGVPHPHNCLRHSFATYHLAARTNPGLTAYLLCHRNQQKLWENYKGDAAMAEGQRWETITPATAEALAREWRDEMARRQPQLAAVVPLQLPA